jgi:hypothetical protein
MNEIWFILVTLLALPYLLIPLLIKRHQSFSLQPQLRKVVGDFVPKSTEAYFKKVGNRLKKLGFEHRVDVVSRDFGPNLRVFMRLFIEKSHFTIATCSSLIPDGASKPVKNFLEFNAKFFDGWEISTHNSDLSSAPIEYRKKIISVFPSFIDIKLLHRFHQQIVSQFNMTDKQALIPAEGYEFEFLVQTFKDDLSRQADLGCLELDAVNSCYRPTWAGAFLIGWYSMWPISSLRRLMQKLRGKLKIRALEKAGAL